MHLIILFPSQLLYPVERKETTRDPSTPSNFGEEERYQAAIELMKGKSLKEDTGKRYKIKIKDATSRIGHQPPFNNREVINLLKSLHEEKVGQTTADVYRVATLSAGGTRYRDTRTLVINKRQGYVMQYIGTYQVKERPSQEAFFYPGG